MQDKVDQHANKSSYVTALNKAPRSAHLTSWEIEGASFALQAIVGNAVRLSAVNGTTASPIAGSNPPQYPYQGLPLDPSGVYIIITDPSVSVTGMCTQ